jgi:hypothetical protein
MDRSKRPIFEEKSMKTALIVTEPFGQYLRGDQITNAKEMAAVLASESAASVNKVQIPDAPADPDPKQ